MFAEKIIENNKLASMMLPLLLAALLLVIPLSTSLKSIVLPLTIFCCLLDKTTRELFFFNIKKPWVIACFLLFSYALLACFWSPALLNEKFLIFEKYTKLLYLPILAAGFIKAKTRNLALNTFLLAMIITAIVGFIKLKYYHYEDDEIFHNHIITSHMTAFAAYITLALFAESRKKIYIVLFFLFTYQIFFINYGRTGYVVYPLLMGIFLLQKFPFKKIILGFMALIVFLTFTYSINPIMREQVSDVYNNVKQYQHEIKNTAIGYRLQFHKFAEKMFWQRPIFGNGTASFTHQYANDKPIPDWTRRLLEPHGEYWLIAAEWGVVGIILFITFLITVCLEIIKLDKNMRLIGIGILIPFILGNLSDSLLLHSGSGYFFLSMFALVLGQNYSRKSLIT